jgi:hypothetical protein
MSNAQNVINIAFVIFLAVNALIALGVIVSTEDGACYFCGLMGGWFAVCVIGVIWILSSAF